MNYKKIAFFICVFSISLGVNAQTIDDIISKYISFSGGQKNWKKVKSIVTSGIYNYGGIKFPFTSYSKAPNLYKYLVPFEGKYFAQAYDGKTGWKIDAFKGETTKTVLNGKDAIAMMNEADVELENPFIHYKRKGHQAILEGIDTVNGGACFKVKFIKVDADTQTCFFSVDNFALVKKQAISKNAELDKSLLDIFYSNYTLVNGINIPFQQMYTSNNQNILIITIQKADVNVPVSDAEFKQ